MLPSILTPSRLPKARTIKTGDCVGIIPARWGSTRFPGKILTPVAGKPLLTHIIRGCRQSKRVKRWIVATDDARISECAEACGVEAVMTPASLKSGSDRAAFVSRRIKSRWIVNWQGDEWTPSGRPIDMLIDALESDAESMVATLARPIDFQLAQNPNRVKVVLSQSRRALYFSRAPIPHAFAGTEPFWLHMGAYAFERSMLSQFARWRPTPLEMRERLEQLRLLEHDVPIAVGICRIATHSVDVPDDAIALERLIGRGRSNT